MRSGPRDARRRAAPASPGGSPRRRGRRLLAAALLATLLALGAARAQTPATEGWIALRVLDLDASRGAIDVWLDGVPILAAVPTGEPTAYVLVPAGPHRIEIEPAAQEDGDPAGGDAAAADAAPDARRTAHETGDVAPGAYVTLLLPPADAAPGEGGDTDGAPALLLDDRLATLPPAGRAGLRLVHAAPGTDRVALVSRDPDLRHDAPPLFESSDDAASGHVARLGPLEASDYAMLPEGDKALWLVPEEGEPVLAEPLEAPLRAGTLYTLYLVPDREGGVRARLAIDATAPVPPGRED